MTEQKRTEWFLMQITPVYIGVYEHLAEYGYICFSRWNGQHWCANSARAARAAQSLDKSNAAYNGEIKGWRGLAEKPE